MRCFRQSEGMPVRNIQPKPTLEHGKRREFLASASRLLLVTGLAPLAACSTVDEPTLNIATNQWIGYELLYLGRELKQVDAHDPDGRVRLVELLSNSDSLQALAAGTVQGAGLTLDEALSARASGLDLKVVLIFDASAGADVLLTQPGITQLTGLRGKRIGVERTGVGALMLDAVLRQAGLKPSEVEVIDLTVDRHLTAFKNRQLDAVITFEPIASLVAQAGGLRLFDSRAIPGGIVDVLAIKTQALASSPRAVRQLLADYFASLTYLNSHPQDALKRMAPRLNLTPAELQAGYQGIKLLHLEDNHRLLAGSPPPLESAASTLAGLMLRQRLLSHPISLSEFCDNRFLPELPS